MRRETSMATVTIKKRMQYANTDGLLESPHTAVKNELSWTQCGNPQAHLEVQGSPLYKIDNDASGALYSGNEVKILPLHSDL